MENQTNTLSIFTCKECKQQYRLSYSEEIADELYCGECYEKLINAKISNYEVSYSYKTFFGKIGAGVLMFESDNLELLQINIFKAVIDHLKENGASEGLQNLQITIHENDENIITCSYCKNVFAENELSTGPHGDAICENCITEHYKD